jgi:hypothetical protein
MVELKKGAYNHSVASSTIRDALDEKLNYNPSVASPTIEV